jgi:hypothetical protein
MHNANRARALRAAVPPAKVLKAGYRALMPAAGLLAVGATVIARGGLIGSVLASPLAPSIEALAIIRMAGIGVFSVGIGLLPAPDVSALRGLLAYSALATLYFCSLMLAATLVGASWPAGWIVAAAAFHGVALVATVAGWLRQRSVEGFDLIRRT